MVDPAVKQEILEELDRMSVEKQRQVLAVIRSYREPEGRPAPASGWRSVFGAVRPEDLREVDAAIEEAFEGA